MYEDDWPAVPAYSNERPNCPECGETLDYCDELFVLAQTDTIVGCSCCLRAHNALEWMDNANI